MGIVPDLSESLAPLANLPNAFRQARMQATRERALSQLGQGAGPLDYATTARALLAAGDTEGGLTLARLADTATERARQQQNADRAFALQEKQFNATQEGSRIPPGFERDPAGGLQPIKGGPASPQYMAAVKEAKDERHLNPGDIAKLSEEGGKFSQINDFVNTFNPNFAGYKSNLIASPVLAAGRFVPELTTQNAADAAKWWQGYDRYKNVVRNELFGSALTATEKAAFEAADITPGMAPDTIKANLATQQKVLQGAMKRRGGALVSEGYKPESIARAFGTDLEGLGIPTKKAPASAGGGTTRPPDAAIKALQARPELRADFDAKYGAGASARILGGP